MASLVKVRRVLDLSDPHRHQTDPGRCCKISPVSLFRAAAAADLISMSRKPFGDLDNRASLDYYS